MGWACCSVLMVGFWGCWWLILRLLMVVDGWSWWWWWWWWRRRFPSKWKEGLQLSVMYHQYPGSCFLGNISTSSRPIVKLAWYGHTFVWGKISVVCWGSPCSELASFLLWENIVILKPFHEIHIREDVNLRVSLIQQGTNDVCNSNLSYAYGSRCFSHEWDILEGWEHMTPEGDIFRFWRKGYLFIMLCWTSGFVTCWCRVLCMFGYVNDCTTLHGFFL